MIPNFFHFKKLRNNYGILWNPGGETFIMIVNFAASADMIDFSRCLPLSRDMALHAVEIIREPESVKAAYRAIIKEGWDE